MKAFLGGVIAATVLAVLAAAVLNLGVQQPVQQARQTAGVRL